MDHVYDVAILGAGSAGLSALRPVQRETENYIVINAGAYGTTCARNGCMPSKALIEAANAYHHRLTLAAMGIGGGDRLTIDIPAVLRRVRALRDAFVGGVLQTTDQLGERSVAGTARFLEPGVLDVHGQRVRTRSVIIATGSRPVVPKPWQALGDRILTSDTLFEQENLPRRIAVVGLGGIGTEMAQALSRLGVEVTAFDAAKRIAKLSDPEVSAKAIELMRSEFPVHLGHQVELASEGSGVRVRTEREGVLADKVLVALGRRPNLEELDLKRLGVKLDEHGMPPFDPETMQVADLRVYVAGDVDGHRPLLHEAADDGYIAGYNSTREKAHCFQRRTPLAIFFTDPNIAIVGEPHENLTTKDIIAGQVDFRDQGRARMAGEGRGLLRIYADRASGRLLGAELCAPRGEHMAHFLALAIQQKLGVPDLLRTPFYHPVIEEGLRTALRHAAKQLSDGGDAADLARCDRVPVESLQT